MPITEQVNAKKNPVLADQAIRLARQTSEIVAAKGKKTVRVNLKKNKPTDDELRKLVVGPSGKLRAPTIRIGKKMIVGFLDEMYAEELGWRLDRR